MLHIIVLSILRQGPRPRLEITEEIEYYTEWRPGLGYLPNMKGGLNRDMKRAMVQREYVFHDEKWAT
ncbi:MAG TPA: hypothetical protein VMW03_06660 [Candidatus Krumholzibacteriaceae bacterium]|nr:hypothetical protein [Candidatus Krumholzibacteriaceae bacterium]